MYEDNNYNKINWKDLLIKLGILVLVVALILWLVPKFTGNSGGGGDLSALTDRIFAENIDAMRSSAANYYTTDRLPSNIGDSTSMTLQQMIDNKLLVAFTDKNGKSCDTQNSYVQVTKTKESEYSLKVLLNCNGQNDYIIDTIGCNGTCGTIDCEGLAKEIAKKVVEEVCTSGCLNTNTSNNNKPNNNSNNTSTPKPTPVTNYYIVQFNTNGGSKNPDDQKIKEGNKATKPSNPTKTDCTFDGWYYNGAKFDFNTAIKKSYILTAKWVCKDDTKASYNVTFDSDGGNYNPKTQNVLEGNNATRPTDPTKTNCTFNGWYYNNSLFKFTTVIKQNYKLVAKWTCSSSSYKLYRYAPYKEVVETIQLGSVGWATTTGTMKYEVQMPMIPTKNTTAKLSTSGSVMSNTSDFSNYLAVRYQLVMTGGSNPNGSGYYDYNATLTELLTYSAKSNNMTTSVSAPYLYDGVWRVELNVNITNTTGIQKVWFARANNYIFFVPTKYAITYTTKSTTEVDMTQAYWSTSSITPSGHKLIETKTVNV